MSTEKKSIKIKKIARQEDRFAKIARLVETVFHTKDLANLWQIKNQNTLYTTIKRYIKKGLLFKIYKGFYSIKPIEEINPLLLGLKSLHKFAYVSAETVLSQEGIIQQSISQITLISSQSVKFSIGDYDYYSRKLDDKYLYNTIGIADKNGIKTATVERAVADLLYFNPKIYFDGERLIDWRKVKKIQRKIGYPLTLDRFSCPETN